MILRTMLTVTLLMAFWFYHDVPEGVVPPLWHLGRGVGVPHFVLNLWGKDSGGTNGMIHLPATM